MLNRDKMLERLSLRDRPWDILVIGGGATGAGVALDAAARGYDVLLLEKFDFGKGTSSRSTKLVHGGVRYLEQGNIPLVMEALKERGLLRLNAPHLVHDLPFIVPNYDWWEAPFYGMGLKMYDLLAGKYGFGKSRLLSKEEILEELPTIKQEGLRGGVIYYDGQFDDSRLLINLISTASEEGACLLNYFSVEEISKDGEGYVNGVIAKDAESGKEHKIQARVLVNASGAFSDRVRLLAEPRAKRMIAPSQGIHLVFDRQLMPGKSAIMVPHTSDGRVMFAIPWHNHIVVGTTDTAIESADFEPKPFEHEIEFVLETASQYLSRKPSRKDILSVFVGIRPLVKAAAGGSTAALSRDHTIHIDPSGLLTICGGKWTTYRKMAEEAVEHAAMLGKLEERPCRSKNLKIHGHAPYAPERGHFYVYGSDLEKIEALWALNPELKEQLHSRLPYTKAELVWAVRHEMACRVEDFLARRSRALFLDADAAMEMSESVAQIMARELGKDRTWIESEIADFKKLAQQYRIDTNPVSTR